MPFYIDNTAAQNDGLVHYWPMNEASGAAVADTIGTWAGSVDDALQSLTASEIDATIVATPAGSGRDVSANWAGPGGGSFANFAPIILPSPPSTAKFSSFTFRARYFHRSTIWEDDANFSYFDIVFLGSDDGLLIEVYELNGGAETYIRAGSFNSTTVASNVFTEGQWHDVIVAGDNNGVSLYINGTEVASLAGQTEYAFYTSGASTTFNVPGMLGAYREYDGSGNYYYQDSSPVDGIIQDAAIWDRKLTATDVANLNTAGMSDPLIATTAPVTETQLDATLPVQFSASAFQDWLSLMSPLQLQEFYSLTITGAADGVTDIVVPISSWQATNQTGGRQSYVQAVVPSISPWLDEIGARQAGELVIRKGYRFDDGTERQEEILRSGFDTFRWDRGPRSFTATISGYLAGKQSSSGQRTLTGIRSISMTNGKHRVRCDIDLFLQPGMTVTADNVTFRADFINYYVASTDKFCEVSER